MFDPIRGGEQVYRAAFIPGLHDTCMVFEKTAKMR